MKLSANTSNLSRAARRARAGMTLMEVLIASTVMVVVIAGVMSANFLGLREGRLLESKAGANDTARRAINQLLYEIRAAKGFEIGTMSGTNFTAISSGSLQGAGLQLFSAIISTNQVINTNTYTLYYFDTSQAASGNGMLWRKSGAGSAPVVAVSNLINTLYFTSEDYLGNTQTVRTYKGVVHTTLQFAQFQYPLTAVGTNGLYDYYRIDCRATPHLPDGP